MVGLSGGEGSGSSVGANVGIGVKNGDGVICGCSAVLQPVSSSMENNRNTVALIMNFSFL